ncbi:tetrathionate reductase family octaheme c-type cytochrome [Thermodesulfatator autotrophicus]|uniref:Cytochrome c7-like domain-containing protein n=1 Tax=Thermodesulfatator autotrophicus TaxID=1795632 RepID=A0A177EA09_9BACT|nr:tetrathionate reductase family octaheme c-type cytochrome [Thermodesulfatator autotrophicus]OAG28755.1 hypothetical protein TH606_00385 [Thermodesulfatator autotrophicus]
MVSNWCRCTSCHAGYGWKDKNFDLSQEEKIDCLVCHDTTGTYKKFPTDCGYPPLKDKVFAGKKLFKAVNLSFIAQNVGRSSRESCGKCHFFSGGGDGVKRGDTDSTLVKASRKLDVHMDAKGLNFSCATCHTTLAHQIAGRHYDTPAPGKRNLALPKDEGYRLKCESCHGARPHKPEKGLFDWRLIKLNDHTDKVACQTCHIPFYARGKPTNTYWDWSTAGRFNNGKPIVEKSPLGPPSYHTKKGTLKWGRNLVPEYFWYNGTFSYLLPGEKVEANEPITLIKPNGSPEDKESRIYPFKVHLGKQPYDPQNKLIIIPKLFGPKGSGAFWADFDWIKASRAGMAEAGLPFSGKVSFVETVQYHALSHMVAPKEDALTCASCHTRKDGRLAKIKGVYLPGRDFSPWLDRIGWLACIFAFIGVTIHGGLRIVLARKSRKED